MTLAPDATRDGFCPVCRHHINFHSEQGCTVSTSFGAELPQLTSQCVCPRTREDLETLDDN